MSTPQPLGLIVGPPATRRGIAFTAAIVAAVSLVIASLLVMPNRVEARIADAYENELEERGVDPSTLVTDIDWRDISVVAPSHDLAALALESAEAVPGVSNVSVSLIYTGSIDASEAVAVELSPTKMVLSGSVENPATVEALLSAAERTGRTVQNSFGPTPEELALQRLQPVAIGLVAEVVDLTSSDTVGGIAAYEERVTAVFSGVSTAEQQEIQAAFETARLAGVDASVRFSR